MAHDNAESYHPVPSIRRAREKSPLATHGEKTNLTDEHGPVTRTEVEKHDNGTAHVTAHHAKGHVEVHQHPNVAAAHDHAENLMSGGDSMNSDTKGDGSEQECPNCGGEMVDGKCSQCGYESPEEKGESKEFEAGEQEGKDEY